MITLALLLAAQVPATGPVTYRLQGDALALSRAPTGIFALSGDGRVAQGVTAEALIWAGVNDAELDALVATLELRHPDGLGELRAGRMILGVGALLPVHFDGLMGRIRAPWGTSLEAFAGAPVVPRFAYRGGDWYAGGRLAQRFGTFGRIGVAYGHRTDDTSIADQEVALDGVVTPTDDVDVATRVAYDISGRGVSEAEVTTAYRWRPLRFSAVARHRSPARLLPATSIFSALGDTPSNMVIVGVDWRAAPRLRVFGHAGARHTDDWGADLRLEAILALDDTGTDVVGLELVRSQIAESGWMGGRVYARATFLRLLTVSAEAELARTAAGDVWPWALAALRAMVTEQLELAAAVEASSTPEYEHVVQVIGRAGYTWSVR